METNQHVFEKIQALGRAHREFRHAQSEAERYIDEIQEAWVRDHEHLLEDDDGDLDDELITEAKTYFLVGKDQYGTLSAELRMAADAGRASRDKKLSVAREPSNSLAEATRGPAADFSQALRRWLREARAEKDFDEFPRILREWRQALSMVTREAATALDVSSSAIVRYESGKRTPSAPQVRALVERIVDWDPVKDTPAGVALRRLARMFDEDPDDLIERTDRDTRENLTRQVAIQDAIQLALEDLTAAQLGTVASLVNEPAALDRLGELARNHPFQLVADALAQVEPSPSKACS